jgi:hypothetical protein
MAGGEQGGRELEDEGVWRVRDGETQAASQADAYRTDGVENLTYSNPYGVKLERVWFEGKIVYAISGEEVAIAFDDQQRPKDNKVAQEYQVVYAVELDEHGQLKDGQEPERVEGQLNIYDSVPGMDKYSPLWQFNYVVVPRDYEPNSLRSEADCRNSGYPIQQSTVVEN